MAIFPLDPPASAPRALDNVVEVQVKVVVSKISITFETEEQSVLVHPPAKITKFPTAAQAKFSRG